MKKDNRGLSLIELVVVMAIMGILIFALFSGSGYQASTAASSLASSIKTAIGETRIKTMGKQETVLRLYQGTDGRYYKQYIVKVKNTVTEENEELIGKHYPTVEYTIDGTTYSKLSDATNKEIFIGFDRTNGKEKAVTLNIGGANKTSILCKGIRVTGGGRVCNVKIEPATGKVVLE